MCLSSYYAIGVITQANLAFSIWKRIDLFNSSIGIIDCEGEAEAWKDLMGKAIMGLSGLLEYDGFCFSTKTQVGNCGNSASKL